MRRLTLILSLALTLAACDSNDDPPTVSGEYEVTVTMNGVDQENWLNLTEDALGTLTGRYMLFDGFTGLLIGGDVEGTHNHPDIALNIDYDSSDDETYLEGTVSGDGDELRFVVGQDQRVVTFIRE